MMYGIFLSAGTKKGGRCSEVAVSGSSTRYTKRLFYSSSYYFSVLVSKYISDGSLVYFLWLVSVAFAAKVPRFGTMLRC